MVNQEPTRVNKVSIIRNLKKEIPMDNLNALWMLAIFIIAFFVFFLVAMVLRNRAAKRDDVGKNESDSVSSSVSKVPKPKN